MSCERFHYGRISAGDGVCSQFLFLSAFSSSGSGLDLANLLNDLLGRGALEDGRHHWTSVGATSGRGSGASGLLHRRHWRAHAVFP